MMSVRQFHLGDILSVTTGRLVSPRHINGVYDILNWMTGEELFTHQLGRVSQEATPVLIAALPWLDDPEITTMAVGKLVLMLGTDAGKAEPEKLIAGWLSELVSKYGEMHAVPKMTAGEHKRIDPESELAERVHPDRIIVVAP